jgi:hypothetical protein
VHAEDEPHRQQDVHARAGADQHILRRHHMSVSCSHLFLFYPCLSFLSFSRPSLSFTFRILLGLSLSPHIQLPTSTYFTSPNLIFIAVPLLSADFIINNGEGDQPLLDVRFPSVTK